MSQTTYNQQDLLQIQQSPNLQQVHQSQNSSLTSNNDTNVMICQHFNENQCYPQVAQNQHFTQPQSFTQPQNLTHPQQLSHIQHSQPNPSTILNTMLRRQNNAEGQQVLREPMASGKHKQTIGVTIDVIGDRGKPSQKQVTQKPESQAPTSEQSKPTETPDIAVQPTPEQRNPIKKANRRSWHRPQQ